jgi:integrating conjugative element protein (TIGR03749 family)
MKANNNFRFIRVLLTIGWAIDLWLVALLLLPVAQAQAAETRRITWTGEPIKIELGVNQERLLTFPADIFVEYNKATDPGLQRIRIQIIKNTAYLKATSSVPSSRLIIGEIKSQKRYLLDVQAVKTSKHYPQVVVEDGTSTSSTSSGLSGSNIPYPAFQENRSAGYVSLIRFAAKELYAPDRLRGTDKNITRATVTKKRVHHLLRGHVGDTRPVAAWKSGELYITALEVKNTTSQPLFLDPRDARGAWKAVSFQNNRLEAKGKNGDTTAMYVVSDLPFSQAIRGYAIRVGRMHR